MNPKHTVLILSGAALVALLMLRPLRRLTDEHSARPLAPFAVVAEAGAEPLRTARTRVAAGPDALPSTPDVRATREAVATDRRPIGPPSHPRSGRVNRPGSARVEDSLTVVALGRELPGPSGAEGRRGRRHDGRSWESHEVLARAPVARDGSFELSLPDIPADVEVQLDLDGRFHYLPAPVSLNPSMADGPTDDDLVLEAELGGVLRGVLRLPAGRDEIPRSSSVGVFGLSYAGATVSRAMSLEHSVEFELCALPADLRYAVWASTGIHPGARLDHEVRVSAGQVVEVVIELRQGVTVRGEVVDAAGAPVAGARVRGNTGAHDSLDVENGTAQTDTEGRFELRGLLPDMQELSVRAENYLPVRSDLLQLADGEVLEDLRLVLEAGDTMAGRVRWPDGRPAAGARLAVIPLELSSDAWSFVEKARSPEGSAVVAEDGSFRLGGLQPGQYAVHAAAAPASAGADAPRWSARCNEVSSDATDLVLTLSEPLSCTGQVVDDVGRAIDGFTVTAQRADWPLWMEGPSVEVEHSFTAAAGRFELDGLDPGPWTLSVTAEGHLRAEDRRVELPATEAPVFALTRTGQVTGLVLDPMGRPVAGAEVRASAESVEGRSEVVTTDEEGRFVMHSVGPGPVILFAEAEGWAPSTEERFELESGQAIAERIVPLHRGGTLLGLVYDAAGQPEVGRTIVVQSSTGAMHEALSDDAGRFRVEHLAAGSYQVIAAPDPDADAEDWGELLQDIRLAMATVLDDQTVEVVLGAPPRAPVQIHGRVTRGGQACAGANVMVFAETGRILESMRGDTAGEDGRFELRLDEPGPHTFVVMGAGGLSSEAEFAVTIPAASEHELVLEMPEGSIAGLVLGPDGAPVRGGVVWIQREDGPSPLSELMGQGPVNVEEDGTFQAGSLHAGHYAITAASNGSGLNTLHGVSVEHGMATTGVVLRLAAPGRLTGTVRDAGGRAVEGATVFLRDAEGHRLHRLSASTDHAGRFTVEQVPAGDVSVSARTSSEVVGSPVRVHVPTGGDAAVELHLEPGVILQVELVDAAEQPLHGAVQLLNESGQDLAGWASQAELQDFFEQGEFAPGHRIGPVPPGPYTLQATGSGGQSLREEVVLRVEDGPQSLRRQLSP